MAYLHYTSSSKICHCSLAGDLHLSWFQDPGVICAHPLFRALCHSANTPVVDLANCHWYRGYTCIPNFPSAHTQANTLTCTPGTAYYSIPLSVRVHIAFIHSTDALRWTEKSRRNETCGATPLRDRNTPKHPFGGFAPFEIVNFRTV